ncbi:hypothetical protein [Dactylosporangium sp. NPDC051541]|uniref:hypothetical protein n=1 Tax=Dactylosporangium sp. NPDC051541 TaxID=3363977 RepID=UPI00379CB453
MNDLFTPPAGRDLPPGRAEQMRAELLADITGPARPARPVRGRVGVGLVLAGVVAVAATGVSAWSGRGGEQLLALGPDEMSPTLRAAAERCLLEGQDMHPRPLVASADLAVGAERADHVALLFLSEHHYFACDEWDPPGESRSMSLAADTDGPAWHHDWLPGPVDRLLLTSTERDGGDVVVIGRVSARVHQLVLDHGDGRKTVARIADGAFGIIAQGDIHEADHPALVSYDSAGREIDRRPLFVPFDRLGRCYVDPEGTIVYGTPGPACRPAEPWTR